ncbi:hypothetical protein CCHR01_12443 [Colletotrichum chrysophilum]|uniref:Uncharacterized protein n=1 Tax=Colletotrichum chrysophilum TaxID=1836956 RepID=A0AAD9AC72_9PEZI|nr:hypothetical protein CCHR01_12443 [Colletotrichum chrysophilum]
MVVSTNASLANVRMQPNLIVAIEDGIYTDTDAINFKPAKHWATWPLRYTQCRISIYQLAFKELKKIRIGDAVRVVCVSERDMKSKGAIEAEKDGHLLMLHGLTTINESFVREAFMESQALFNRSHQTVVQKPFEISTSSSSVAYSPRKASIFMMKAILDGEDDGVVGCFLVQQYFQKVATMDFVVRIIEDCMSTSLQSYGVELARKHAQSNYRKVFSLMSRSPPTIVDSVVWISLTFTRSLTRIRTQTGLHSKIHAPSHDVETSGFAGPAKGNTIPSCNGVGYEAVTKDRVKSMRSQHPIEMIFWSQEGRGNVQKLVGKVCERRTTHGDNLDCVHTVEHQVFGCSDRPGGDLKVGEDVPGEVL